MPRHQSTLAPSAANRPGVVTAPANAGILRSSGKSGQSVRRKITYANAKYAAGKYEWEGPEGFCRRTEGGFLDSNLSFFVHKRLCAPLSGLLA